MTMITKVDGHNIKTIEILDDGDCVRIRVRELSPIRVKASISLGADELEEIARTLVRRAEDLRVRADEIRRTQ
jgi:hypothetical protein